MAGKFGGAQPGAGAKKNQHRIACGDLRKAIEAEIGMPYHEMLAQTQKKLFLDFQQDKNIKEFVRFTENMSHRILENPESTVNINDASELTREQIQDRINNLLARKALSESAGATTTPTAPDASPNPPENG